MADNKRPAPEFVPATPPARMIPDEAESYRALFAQEKDPAVMSAIIREAQKKGITL